MRMRTKARNKQTIEFTKFNNKEHGLAICHTNDMVDAINKNGMNITLKQKTNKLLLMGLITPDILFMLV